MFYIYFLETDDKSSTQSARSLSANLLASKHYSTNTKHFNNIVQRRPNVFDTDTLSAQGWDSVSGVGSNVVFAW